MSVLPVRWASPELLETRHVSKKSDVYAFGVTCWEILRDGELPFPTFTLKALIEHITKRRDIPLKIEETWPPLMKDLIAGCLQFEFAERWGIRKAFEVVKSAEKDMVTKI